MHFRGACGVSPSYLTFIILANLLTTITATIIAITANAAICALTALFPASARLFRLYANNNAKNNAIYQYAHPRADEIQNYIIYIENSDYEYLLCGF